MTSTIDKPSERSMTLARSIRYGILAKIIVSDTHAATIIDRAMEPYCEAVRELEEAADDIAEDTSAYTGRQWTKLRQALANLRAVRGEE